MTLKWNSRGLPPSVFFCKGKDPDHWVNLDKVMSVTFRTEDKAEIRFNEHVTTTITGPGVAELHAILMSGKWEAE